MRNNHSTTYRFKYIVSHAAAFDDGRDFNGKMTARRYFEREFFAKRNGPSGEEPLYGLRWSRVSVRDWRARLLLSAAALRDHHSLSTRYHHCRHFPSPSCTVYTHTHTRRLISSQQPTIEWHFACPFRAITAAAAAAACRNFYYCLHRKRV